MRRLRIAAFCGAALVGDVGALALPQSGSAQAPIARASGDSVHYSIALLTVGPGSAPNTWFGHSALIVDDGTPGGARIYGYGTIARNVRTVSDAIRGQVNAFARSAPAWGELARLAREKRTTRIQDIALAAPAARRLIAKLEMESVRLPLSYRYDVLSDNCSTRIRDLLDEATGGRLRATLSSMPSTHTLREAGIEAIAGSAFRTAFVDLLLGSAADAPGSEWELSAVPAQLANAIGSVKDLATERALVQTVPHESAPVPFLLIGGVVAAIAIGTALILRTRPRAARIAFGGYSALIGLSLGIPGLMIVGASLLGVHNAMLHNANIVLANPLTLVALPLGVLGCAGNARATAWLSRLWTLLAVVAMAGAGFFYAGAHEQHIARMVALLLPVLVGNAIAFRVALPTARRASAARKFVLLPTS